MHVEFMRYVQFSKQATTAVVHTGTAIASSPRISIRQFSSSDSRGSSRRQLALIQTASKATYLAHVRLKGVQLVWGGLELEGCLGHDALHVPNNMLKQSSLWLHQTQTLKDVPDEAL